MIEWLVTGSSWATWSSSRERRASTRRDRNENGAAMIIPAQIRAAWVLLDWRQIDLAKAAGVSDPTIINFERGPTDPLASTLDAMRHALESARGIFVEENGDGPGVRLRKVTKR
jgi:DNA-binding XRE family transcriptional regulator